MYKYMYMYIYTYIYIYIYVYIYILVFMASCSRVSLFLICATFCVFVCLSVKSIITVYHRVCYRVAGVSVCLSCQCVSLESIISVYHRVCCRVAIMSVSLSSM